MCFIFLNKTMTRVENAVRFRLLESHVSFFGGGEGGGVGFRVYPKGSAPGHLDPGFPPFLSAPEQMQF